MYMSLLLPKISNPENNNLSSCKMLEPSKEAKEERSAQSKEVLDKVKKVLEDKEAMEELCKINQEEIEQYKKTLKAIQKIELVLAENPGKYSKSIKVTDKYLLSEVFFVCVDDCIKRGVLTDKLKKLNV